MSLLYRRDGGKSIRVLGALYDAGVGTVKGAAAAARGSAGLSGALYSANVQEAMMLVSPAVKDRLPGDIRRHVRTNRAGLDVLVFADWSLGELGVPPYPEPRVYRSVARAVCAYAPTPSEAELIIFGRPHPWTGARETTREDCAALSRW